MADEHRRAAVDRAEPVADDVPCDRGPTMSLPYHGNALAKLLAAVRRVATVEAAMLDAAVAGLPIGEQYRLASAVIAAGNRLADVAIGQLDGVPSADAALSAVLADQLPGPVEPLPIPAGRPWSRQAEVELPAVAGTTLVSARQVTTATLATWDLHPRLLLPESDQFAADALAVVTVLVGRAIVACHAPGRARDEAVFDPLTLRLLANELRVQIRVSDIGPAGPRVAHDPDGIVTDSDLRHCLHLIRGGHHHNPPDPATTTWCELATTYRRPS